jgi:uncharacterized delta-60 repeat protein
VLDRSATGDENASQVVVAPDGQYYVAGGIVSPANIATLTLMRLGPDGTVDTSFAAAGTASVPLSSSPEEHVGPMLILPDGKFLFAGRRRFGYTNSSRSDVLLLRLNPDGSPDETFGAGGFRAIDVGSTGDVTADLVMGPDGKPVVTGRRGSGWFAMRLQGEGQGPAARVVGRHVFYNRSGFDGNDGAANAADDNAIAPDKNALLASQDRLPGFDNVTSYDKGINGIMVDIANLPAGGVLSADDFDFGSAGAPLSVTVRRDAGAEGSDRVTLVWRDYNPLDASPLPQAVGNGWLTVTVKANADTGLSQPDVFRFANLIGETGDSFAAPRVSAIDLAAVKRALNGAAPLAATTDFNRDVRTNAIDLAIVKRNLNHSLPVFASPTPAPAGGHDDEPAASVAALLADG